MESEDTGDTTPDITEVVKLELLCKQLYEANDGVQQHEAEKALVEFQSGRGAATLSQCRLLLDRAKSPYTQHFAVTTLTKLASRMPCTLSLQHRMDMRTYALDYLASHPKLVHYVTQGLVVLIVRVTKEGWFDALDKNKWAFRNVVGDVTRFLQGSVEQCVIGVQLLAQLTAEMNHVSESDKDRSLTKHKQIRSSFRDNYLYDIFKLSCRLLGTSVVKRGELPKSFINFDEENQHRLMKFLLKLGKSISNSRQAELKF
nr:exportin-7-like [Procambarus clarkii]